MRQFAIGIKSGNTVFNVMSKLMLILLTSTLFLACGNSLLSSTPPSKVINADKIPPVYSVPTPTPVEEPEIKKKWHQQNNDLTFDWNGSDLSVTLNGKKISDIFKRISEARYDRIRQDSNTRDCDVTLFFKPASVVDTMFSFEQEEGLSCGTTTIDWRYTTIDLADTQGLDLPSFSELGNKKFNAHTSTPLVSLTKWFTEDEILQALLANQDIASGIERAIQSGKLTQPPTNLSKFGKLFSPIDYDSFGDLFLEKDFLTRFTFHHIDGDRVVVWISLTPTSHAAQAVRDHLEIRLPISGELRTSLTLADTGERGFLSKDASKFVGTSSAEFEYTK